MRYYKKEPIVEKNKENSYAWDEKRYVNAAAEIRITKQFHWKRLYVLFSDGV